MVGLMTPVPHTPYFEQVKRENRLLDGELNFDNTDANLIFQPKRMSIAEAYEELRFIYERLFNRRNAYRRIRELLARTPEHIFWSSPFQIRYLKATALSVWRQGLRRMDHAYFALLKAAYGLDRAAIEDAKRELMVIDELAQGDDESRRDRLRGGYAHAGNAGADVRLHDVVRYAKQYVIRYRSELPIAAIEKRLSP